MAKEILTPEERLNAAIQFKSLDRIPCAPWIECYAARYHKISNYEFHFNRRKAFDALAAVKKRFPVWDVRRSQYYNYYGPYQGTIGNLKNKMPGIDLPADYEFQFVEYEAMDRKDYSIILEKGFDACLWEFYKRIHGTTDEEIGKALSQKEQIHKEELEEGQNCGQVNLYGAAIAFSADCISFMRSFNGFIRDIFQIPDIMEEVISIATDAHIDNYIEFVKKSGIPRIFIGLARMSGQYFSLSFFERFVWSYLKRYIYRFLGEGITPILHLDGDWGRNLHYFLEIPKQSIVIEFDGCTDIFSAKKILGDHVCLLGDVPSTLFTVGTPEKVAKYCRRLIEDVGEGGGLILGSGCYLPYLADHSNVEAFFNSVNYSIPYFSRRFL